MLRIDEGFDGLPDAVTQRAKELYEKVEGKPTLCGDSDVVDGYWIETHTLGCRDAGGDSEDDWWDAHWEFYDKYNGDGTSVIGGDPADGVFITITPQMSPAP